MLPNIPASKTKKTTAVQEKFRGLNHNSYLDSTELYDMKNMSGDNYPFASPRSRRGIYKTSGGVPFGVYEQDSEHTLYCNGITTKQGFLFCEGDSNINHLYYKSNGSDTFLHIGDLTPGEKQFVSLGAYVVIFPDKKFFWSILFEKLQEGQTGLDWLNNHGIDPNAEWFGSLEAQTSATRFYITLCNVYGEEYKADIVSVTPPDEEYEVDGTIWLDISDDKSRIYQFSESYSGWIELATSYIRVTLDSTSTALSRFNDYDGVELSGFPSVLGDFNSSTVIRKIGVEYNEPYFIIPGVINCKEVATLINDSTVCTFSNDYKNMLTIKVPITIKRTVPDMDFVCEQDNRLWGCSNDNHEIYISKQGSPFNFNCFLGLSTDSDVITIGSDGDFTGCISHLGYVLFFKEDRVHKIYGTKPTNYQVTEVMMRGVQKGCFKSLLICNETLFYKSKAGVMMYQGSLPENIGDELGTEAYTDAVAGVYKQKYYISMKDGADVYHLFVYDTETGLWHKEDNTRFRDTLSVLDELYYLDGEHHLMTVGGKGSTFTVKRLVSSISTITTQTGTATWAASSYTNFEYSINPEEEFEWEMESGDLYDGSIDSKYIGRLRILLKLFQDTEINVYLLYDNNTKWEHVFNKKYKYNDTFLDTFNIPIIPRRARRMRIKITGNGKCLIQAIGKLIEQGSEL